MFPGYSVEIFEADRGIAFRLRDARGRLRSGSVRLDRYHDRILDGSNLEPIIRNTGRPRAGFPAGF